jgi:hypothetical protein
VPESNALAYCSESGTWAEKVFKPFCADPFLHRFDVGDAAAVDQVGDVLLHLRLLRQQVDTAHRHDHRQLQSCQKFAEKLLVSIQVNIFRLGYFLQVGTGACGRECTLKVLHFAWAFLATIRLD